MSDNPHATSGSPDVASWQNPLLGLFLISVLGLFLEMMLIRWISTEIRIFAYLQNTILVVCFLGLGLGCFTSREAPNLRRTIVPLFLLTLLMAIPRTRAVLGNISSFLSVLRDMTIFYPTIVQNPTETVLYTVAGLFLTLAVMILILDMFVPLGRVLGRLIDSHPHTIIAYSVNVAGSLVGTWLFVLLSSLYASPVIWSLATVVLLAFFLSGPMRERAINGALCIGIVLCSWFAAQEPGAREVVWSPYQKLVLREAPAIAGDRTRYYVNVNNVRFQQMQDLSPLSTATTTSGYFPVPDGYNHIEVQLKLHPNPRKILILGAGSGNDVAFGLRQGVNEVVAVEIDPAILSMGRRYHPLAPYDSPKVRMVVDDARSFFATCHEKFDVIMFALLDSHTSCALTNTRLDEYVFTRESIERAKALLAEGGILTLNSSAPEFFVADRLVSILKDVFGRKPITFAAPGGGATMIAGNQEAARTQMERDPQLKWVIEEWQNRFPLAFTCSTCLATDDWPYMYLPSPGIPTLYYLLAGLLLILFVRSCRSWGVTGLFTRWESAHWHFFFLGAAFMLLEVQNISKAAVVLGSTWVVNAVIISGVLIMVLVANLIVSRFPRLPAGPVFGILWGICGILYFVDLASFAFLPYLTKALLVGGLATLPMLFSGIIFIRSFQVCRNKDQALGANLFGSLVGAILQSVTFITGIKSLLLVVAGLYGVAFLFRGTMVAPRERKYGRQGEL